jgi:RND family efflux transporter MFP subunit
MLGTLRICSPCALIASSVLALTACTDGPPKGTKAAQSPNPAAVSVFTVVEQDVADLKGVMATLRSKKVVEARVRTPGTVATLKVAEGAHVEPGQVLGLVADPKIALRLKASEAQITAMASRVATARAELDRTNELLKKGVAPQARLDQARTAFDVATNELAAANSERAVIERQAEEGQILAPAVGRVLRVPVTEGSVVMAGESIATIAANEYLLRLEVPERHARFMQKGDILKVGQRGLAENPKDIGEGRITQVYPEIQNGRVIADAEVDGLGTYFVGERTLAWISAGNRKSIVIPQALTFKRNGLDYVRLATNGPPIDVVVQLGSPSRAQTAVPQIEVLAGLKAGDRLVQP